MLFQWESKDRGNLKLLTQIGKKELKWQLKAQLIGKRSTNARLNQLITNFDNGVLKLLKKNQVIEKDSVTFWAPGVNGSSGMSVWPCEIRNIRVFLSCTVCRTVFVCMDALKELLRGLLMTQTCIQHSCPDLFCRRSRVWWHPLESSLTKPSSAFYHGPDWQVTRRP